MLANWLLAAVNLAALPTATIERGGATFDFKAIGERHLAGGTVGENLVTHADFSAENSEDPYRWRGDEYCFIHQPDVDRQSALMKGMKAGVVWSCRTSSTSIRTATARTRRR